MKVTNDENKQAKVKRNIKSKCCFKKEKREGRGREVEEVEEFSYATLGMKENLRKNDHWAHPIDHEK